MKLVWVKGNAPLSKLIMWGLNEPVSHLAIVFDNKIVFHSDLLGVRLAWYPTFLKTHEIVFEMEFDIPLEQEEEVYQSIITRFDGSGYDYGAFMYFSYRVMLKKSFGCKIPDSNPWGSKDKFLCDELVQVLPDYIVPQAVKDMDLGIKSPYQVYLLLNPQR